MRHGDVQLILSPVDNIQHENTPDVKIDFQRPQSIAPSYNHSPPLGVTSPQDSEFHNGEITKALRCKEEELEALVKEISDNHNKFFGDFSEIRSKLPAIEAQYLVSERS